MTESEKEVIDFLIEMLTANGAMNGVSLGVLIRDRFPQLDLKTQYGGLKRFVENHGSDQVVCFQHEGPHVVFALKSALGEIPPSTPSFTSHPKTCWAAFSNPKLASEIFIDPATGELYVAPQADAPYDSYQRVQPISNEEHRMVSREFLSLVEEPLKDELQQALLNDDFWPVFSKILKNHEADGVLEMWSRWREQQVVSLFKNRLDKAGISDEILEHSITCLKRSKGQKSFQAPYIPSKELAASIGREKAGLPWYAKHLASEKQSNNKMVNGSFQSVIDLRSIIHDVVDKLDETELRRISLPIGFVLDAISKKPS